MDREIMIHVGSTIWGVSVPEDSCNRLLIRHSVIELRLIVRKNILPIVYDRTKNKISRLIECPLGRDKYGEFK